MVTSRTQYFNDIEFRLNFLASHIETRGKLNIHDQSIHSENFYRDFLNLLFNWKLENINKDQPNSPGIDLVDVKNQIVAQVSATATAQKVESALRKVPSQFQSFSFKFISISKNAEDLRKKKISNPHSLTFNPSLDIHDIPSILKEVISLKLEKQKEIYEFLEKQINLDPDPNKVESNISSIINVLSKEDWSKEVTDYETRPYDVDKKITYNNLEKAKTLIDDYKVHYPRINKIYAEFDNQGVNKSLSILNGIRSEYVSLGDDIVPDDCFFSIINKVMEIIKKSANFNPIPEEELKLVVGILVVDAFIRCKIFKNPLEESDAHS